MSFPTLAADAPNNPPASPQPPKRSTAKIRRRLALPARRKKARHHGSRPPPAGPEPATAPAAAAPQPPRDGARRDSVHAARAFLRDFVRSRWRAAVPHARVECRLTVAELRGLGRLGRDEGAAACRRLVSVPVVHDEVGLELWRLLAEAANGPGLAGGEGGDGQRRDGTRAGAAEDEAAAAPDRPTAGTSPVVGAVGRRSRTQQRPQREEQQVSSPGRSRRPDGHGRCVLCRDDASDCCSIPGSVRQAAYRASGRFFGDGDGDACQEGEAAPAAARSRRRLSGARGISERVGSTIALGLVSRILMAFGEGLAYGYGGMGSPAGRL